MTKLTHDLIRIVAALSTIGVIACGAEDDGDTNTDPSVASTNPSTTNTTQPDTDTMDETTDDPSTTMTTDNPSTTMMTTDDPSTTMTTTMDTGDECTAEDDCIMDSDCPGGGSCIGCLCIGGEETGTGECGTNVGTMNPACDDCSHLNCCAEVQGCFGDETVTENTPCLELNNCIAMSCTMATTIEELQACVDMNCAEVADQLQAWLAFNNCVFMACAAECAG